jgi:hypothetical protein
MLARRSGAGWRFELRILRFLESAISFPNSENSSLEGQVIVQSAATSPEVRFSTAAGLTASATTKTGLRPAARFIDELAGRDD